MAISIEKSIFIEKSDVILLFYDIEKEGSPKFLYDTAEKYQKEQDYEIRLIQFDELQVLVEEEQWKNEEY